MYNVFECNYSECTRPFNPPPFFSFFFLFFFFFLSFFPFFFWHFYPGAGAICRKKKRHIQKTLIYPEGSEIIIFPANLSCATRLINVVQLGLSGENS